jgi:hypothetical protein
VPGAIFQIERGECRFAYLIRTLRRLLGLSHHCYVTYEMKSQRRARGDWQRLCERRRCIVRDSRVPNHQERETGCVRESCVLLVTTHLIAVIQARYAAAGEQERGGKRVVRCGVL